MNEHKFFRCNHCGNMVGLIHDGGAPMVCCGEPMQELIPNTTEAATEKHLPVVSVKERLVHAAIGSVAHPMTEEHHIEFIYLLTAQGGQMKRLTVGADAAAIFAVLEDAPIAVYEYCNLHGLWKTEVHKACSHTEPKQIAENAEPETCCSAEFSDGCK